MTPDDYKRLAQYLFMAEIVASRDVDGRNQRQIVAQTMAHVRMVVGREMKEADPAFDLNEFIRVAGGN